MPFVEMQPPDRLSYVGLKAVYANMQVLYGTMVSGGTLPDPDYNPVTGETESTGYATLIRDILPKLNRTEANLDALAETAVIQGFVLPEYNTAYAWGAYTYDKYEKVKRWIECLNQTNRILTNQIPKTQFLQTADELNITTSDGKQILCYGEEYYDGNSI